MKHAYLIIANRNYKQLQLLIDMLDDSRNDIYLIIDHKSTDLTYDFHTKYSSLNYVKPLDIYWGSYSIVEAELRLFNAAASQHYSFYHLLSGLDLPLENQDYIHSFFDRHLNKEFIGYGNYLNHNKMYNNIFVRMKHHLFRKYYRSRNVISNIYRGVERRVLEYCFPNKIPLTKIGYASQWLSIDDSLVQLIVHNENWISYNFKYSLCPDELFIPTLMNYHPNILHKVYFNGSKNLSTKEFIGNLRYIKFDKNDSPSPDTWDISNYQELKHAKENGFLFSRKFDYLKDKHIINKIFLSVMD